MDEIEQKKHYLRDNINNDVAFLELLNDFQHVSNDLSQQCDGLALRFKRYKRLPILVLLTIWASFVVTLALMFYLRPDKKNNVQIFWAISLLTVIFSLLYVSILLLNVINFKKIPPARTIFDLNAHDLSFLQCTESMTDNLSIHCIDRRSCLLFFYKHKKKLVTLPKKKFENVGSLISWMNNEAMARFNSKEISVSLYSEFHNNKLTNNALEAFFIKN